MKCIYSYIIHIDSRYGHTSQIFAQGQDSSHKCLMVFNFSGVVNYSIFSIIQLASRFSRGVFGQKLTQTLTSILNIRHVIHVDRIGQKICS